MPSNIQIKILVDGQEINLLGDAAGKLNDLAAAGKQATTTQGDLGSATNKTGSDLKEFLKGTTDLKSAFDIINNQALGMIDNVNEIGVASIRARAGLDAFTGGRAQEYLGGLDKATGGLIDRMTEATEASFLLSHGIASSEPEIENIAHLGAELGTGFMKDAAAGVDALDTALERVGNKRSLYSLNVDVQQVMARYKELQATLGDEQAWHMAVLEGVGATVDKLGDKLNSTRLPLVSRLTLKAPAPWGRRLSITLTRRFRCLPMQAGWGHRIIPTSTKPLSMA
jgi:hypothetical protein